MNDVVEETQCAPTIEQTARGFETEHCYDDDDETVTEDFSETLSEHDTESEVIDVESEVGEDVETLTKVMSASEYSDCHYKSSAEGSQSSCKGAVQGEIRTPNNDEGNYNALRQYLDAREASKGQDFSDCETYWDQSDDEATTKENIHRGVNGKNTYENEDNENPP